MYSHHSHSGDYISHATDTLEEIVQRAKDMGFKTFCLTEHMPRLYSKFLYPEEIDRGYGPDDLDRNFKQYLKHAIQLQEKLENEVDKHGEKLQLLVGFEVEGLDEDHIKAAQQIIDETPEINMCIGSVHYVNQIPIDFSPELWKEAQKSTIQGTVHNLFKDYFELQYDVVTQLKPNIIGHFDLIRLFEPRNDSEIDPITGKLLKNVNLKIDWPDVWSLIIRNIKFIINYGGLFELNSASIRKGWDTAYPKLDIAQAIIDFGGKFCFSDDSHSVSQVGMNYHKLLLYAKQLNLEYIYHLEIIDGKTKVIEEKLSDIEKCSFWDQF